MISIGALHKILFLLRNIAFLKLQPKLAPQIQKSWLRPGLRGVGLLDDFNYDPRTIFHTHLL